MFDAEYGNVVKKLLLPATRIAHPESWRFTARRLFVGVTLLFLCAPVFAGELPFPIGEELTYSISLTGIPVAKAVATTEMKMWEGREVLAIRMHINTYSFFNHLYKVEDFHESLIDLETFLPIQYTKNLKERNYRCHEVTKFDFFEKRAYYEHQTNGKKKEYDIDANTRDILSFMYFMRSEQLDENQKPSYRVMADEKLYDLILDTRDVQKIRLPAYDDKIPSLKMYPEAMFDGLFVRKGKATLWVSCDPRRLLTLAKVRTPIGSVRIKLKAVKGPGDDFWITENEDDD